MAHLRLQWHMLKCLLKIACVQVAGWQLLAMVAAADVKVSELEVVGAGEQEPFDKTVKVRYRLAGTYDSVDVTLSASNDGGESFDVPVETVKGGFGEGDSAAFAAVTTDGLVTVTWNIGADWPGKRSSAMKFRVQAKSYIDGKYDELSTDVSTSFSADTRPIPPLTLKRLKKKLSDGRRLITYESAVTGVPEGNSTVYFQAPLPDSDPLGFGVFYGYEMVKFSNPSVKLYHAIGYASVDPSRYDLEWKPTSFDTLLRIPLNGKLPKDRNLYFKIVRSGETKTFRIRLKAKFACFYDYQGAPVAELDNRQDLVLVFHGRGSGEKTVRGITTAMRRVSDTRQVLAVDWSSGAASSGIELTGGRYLRNLGVAVRERLKSEGFAQKQITTVGHSWGALLSHEVATAWNVGVSRMYVLDPAPEADGYNEKRVNFGVKKRCGFSYGIKGGNRNDGVFGSPNMARSCQYAVNVLSSDPPSNLVKRWHFYHNLPVDWFIRAIQGGQTGVYNPDKPLPYWDHLRTGLLENEFAIPEKIGVPLSVAKDFDLVCTGKTSYYSQKNDATFIAHRSFQIQLKDLGWRYVTLEKKTNGGIQWTLLK